ncbi:MAG: hypothetical protein R2755_14175 [Acidimicrobiales bacterium]
MSPNAWPKAPPPSRLPAAHHDDEVGRLTTPLGTLAGYLRDTSASLPPPSVT